MPQSKKGLSAIVIDTSCLLYLWHLDLLPKLVIRYYPIYIPRHVLEEARRKGRSKQRLQRLLRDNPFLSECDVIDEYAAQLLYDRYRNPRARIDRGEAEVIIQARERGVATVLIDDLRGRKIAQQHNLNVRGILGLLKEFKKINYVEEVRPLIEKIRKKPFHYWIGEELLKKELKEIGEE
jgi:predicted nucleic acid-binding protein